MKNRILLIGLLTAVLGISFLPFNNLHALGSTNRKLIRVGVYDSRAIPMTYTYSKYNDNFMQKTSKEKKQAEAKGDTAKAQELDKQMQQYALRRHKQVFSTTPVNDLLDLVKEKMPQVAKETGVDLIISKWQIDYLDSKAEVVDVTREIAQLFEPEPGTLECIPELMKRKPLKEEEVERLEHPH